MDDDEFFGSVDAKLGAKKKEHDAREDKRTQNLEFAKQAAADAQPIAERYVEKLRERGITAKVERSELGLSFKLRYADSGIWNLTLSPNVDTGKLEFHGEYTNDDGRRFGSWDAMSYDENTWSAETFTKKLQKHIEDYVFYADRHRGVS